jgi:hypothetical protein
MRENNLFGSLPLNLLRAGLILIVIGFFLPIGCKSNGYEIATGILGHGKFGTASMFLRPVSDFYGILLFLVYILALLALTATFVGNEKKRYLIGLVLFGVSLLFALVILIKLGFYFRFADMGFYIKIVFPIKANVLFAGYGMALGYVLGILSFVLKVIRK